MSRHKKPNLVVEPSAPITCFVLMPFSASFDVVYENAIRPAIAASRGVECLRADEIYGPKPIMRDIWNSINESLIIVADLSTRNPNVLYELGLSHAVAKPVILISQSIEDVPFDLRSIRCIVYSNDKSGRTNLRKSLRRTTEQLVKYINAEQTLPPEYCVLGLRDDCRNALIPKMRSGRSKGRLQDPAARAVLRDLRTLNDRDQLKAVLHRDPEMITRLVGCLGASVPEIQLEAIRSIGKLGMAVYSHHLYPFVDSENAELRYAAIEGIGACADLGSVGRLLQLYESATDDRSREVIAEALGNIGGTKVTRYFGDLANNTSECDENRTHALVVLTALATWEAADQLTRINTRTLGPDLRERLAASFANIGHAFGVRAQRIESMLDVLAHDKVAAVRSQAIAAWCVNSVPERDPFLDRTRFWKLLDNQDKEVVIGAFDAMTEYRTPFHGSEGRHLVRLASRVPEITDRIVFSLHEIGEQDVAEFMRDYLREDSQDRTWAAAYFARCPNDLVAPDCEKILEKKEDLNDAVLSAICLAKMNSKKGIEFILSNAGSDEVYSWVHDLVSRFLAARLDYTSDSPARLRIKRMLRRIALAQKRLVD